MPSITLLHINSLLLAKILLETKILKYNSLNKKQDQQFFIIFNKF